MTPRKVVYLIVEPYAKMGMQTSMWICLSLLFFSDPPACRVEMCLDALCHVLNLVEHVSLGGGLWLPTAPAAGQVSLTYSEIKCW